jgi:hypothetical protein
MDELVVRIAFMLVGMIIGGLLGWTSHARVRRDFARDARDPRESGDPRDERDTREIRDERDPRDTRKASMDDNTTTPGSRRTRVPTRSDVVLLILIAVTLAATVTTWRVNDRVDRVATCTTKVTANLLRAVNERTTFTEESARRSLELQDAEKAMLTGVLDPNASREQRREAVRSYVTALEAYQAIQAKATQQRRAWPYPDEKEIDACRT